MEPKLPPVERSETFRNSGSMSPEMSSVASSKIEIENNPRPEQGSTKDTSQSSAHLPITISLPQPLPAAPISGDSVQPKQTAKDKQVDSVPNKSLVDKAKRIIEETEGDPYLREERVSDLQTQYRKEIYDK